MVCDRDLFFVLIHEITRVFPLAYALHRHVDSGIDVLDFGTGSIVVVFCVWIRFDLGRL